MTTKPELIKALQRQANITERQAEAVLSVYKRVKAVKFNAHDGFSIAHGGFMEKAVILRALAQAPTPRHQPEIER